MTTVNPAGAGSQAFAFPAGPAMTGSAPPPSAPPVSSDYEVPDHLQIQAASLPAASAAGEASRQTQEETQQKVEEVNQLLKVLGYRLTYGFYEGTEEFYAQLVDRETNEVIKTIPSEDVLKFHAKLQEALGLLIDETV